MRAALVAFVIALSAAAPALAAPEDVANAISQDVMSPYCPGVTLHDCPSEKAVELREQIAEWASAGWSRQRILDRLVDEFDATILGAPAPEGRGLLAWALPLLALAGGGTLAWMLVRRWSDDEPGEARPAPVPPSPHDRRRLDAALSEFRGDA